MRNPSSWSWKCSARIAALVLLLGATACGDDAGPDDEGGGGAAGMAGAGGMAGAAGMAGAGGMAGAAGMGGAGGGQTTCGISTCEPGQHCNNAICVNGCLTVANCLQNQTCEDIDSFTAIGTCRDKPVAPTKDCKVFCDKAFACMDPDFVLCDQQCAGLSAACVACVNDSNCGAGCDDVCEL